MIDGGNNDECVASEVAGIVVDERDTCVVIGDADDRLSLTVIVTGSAADSEQEVLELDENIIAFGTWGEWQVFFFFVRGGKGSESWWLFLATDEDEVVEVNAWGLIKRWLLFFLVVKSVDVKVKGEASRLEEEDADEVFVVDEVDVMGLDDASNAGDQIEWLPWGLLTEGIIMRDDGDGGGRGCWPNGLKEELEGGWRGAETVKGDPYGYKEERKGLGAAWIEEEWAAGGVTKGFMREEWGWRYWEDGMRDIIMDAVGNGV